MIIEIRKAGFVNKGAELMLHAVMQKVKERYPEATLVMAPSHAKAGQPFHKFAPLGFFPKAFLWRKGIQFGLIANVLPKKVREMYGVVLDREVDVVLDAAGFSYSDQWGTGSCRELASSSRYWKKQGTKVILLPQAFGPFENEKNKKYVSAWIKNIDLVFPRERDSYNYLTKVVGEQNKIREYPDFTNLIVGAVPSGYDSTDKNVALVPNYRMIDKTNKAESEAYLPFMIRCAKYLIAKGAKPFVLVHEGENDRILAQKISDATGGIPIVKETDPLNIKGILGTCEATIGSRFHGLVSALSQGVPSLATGWSHKYARLFENYGFEEGIVSVTEDESVLHDKIDFLLNAETAIPLKHKLIDRSEQLKKLSEEMWQLVFKEMDEKN